MKTTEMNQYGLTELNSVELQEVDGGDLCDRLHHYVDVVFDWLESF